MAKRRRSILGSLATIVLVEIVFAAFIVSAREPYPIFLALIAISVPLAWWSFFMPTYCDYLTARNTPCVQPVRGKLRGCRWHRRQKNDQVFAMFSLRNPGRAFRLAWGAPQTPAAHTVGSGKVAEPSRRNAYDAIMLFATVGSFVTGTAGAVFTAMSL